MEEILQFDVDFGFDFGEKTLNIDSPLLTNWTSYQKSDSVQNDQGQRPRGGFL